MENSDQFRELFRKNNEANFKRQESRHIRQGGRFQA